MLIQVCLKTRSPGTVVVFFCLAQGGLAMLHLGVMGGMRDSLLRFYWEQYIMCVNTEITAMLLIVSLHWTWFWVIKLAVIILHFFLLIQVGVPSTFLKALGYARAPLARAIHSSSLDVASLYPRLLACIFDTEVGTTLSKLNFPTESREKCHTFIVWKTTFKFLPRFGMFFPFGLILQKISDPLYLVHLLSLLLI